MSIFDRIGDLAHRLSERVGRDFGRCRTCGKPTRSHSLGSGVQCHVCHEAGERVALTDGGGREDAVGRGEEAAVEWLEENEALSRAEFDRRHSAFIRTVGEETIHQEWGGNQHLRTADAESVGRFAYENNVALVELDTDVTHADMMGVEFDGGFIPLIVCVDRHADEEDFAERIHHVYHDLDDAAKTDQTLVTDGGETDLDFNYGDLHFIELAGDGSKLPKRAWGGYSQDFDEAGRVYGHEDIEIHPATEWGVVGIDDVEHGSTSLLIFDLDIHKAPDGFDPSDLALPESVPVVETQSGGFHIYFMVHEPKGEGKESDFKLAQDVDWDVDIRGSFVSAHVVAPSDVPGAGGDYDLLNDSSIPGVFDPADAAQQISYRGEQLIEYSPDRGIENGVEIDRDVDPPAEMPTCYHRGLQLRAAAPDDHPNTHKVNVLTAMCGLVAGYDVDTMVDHFCEEFAPGGDADRERTRYQLRHIARKIDRGEYAPPAISTLRDFGILDEREACDCSIEYHVGSGRGSRDGDFDPQPVSAIDLNRLTGLGPTERRRHARRHGIDWPTTDDARTRLRDRMLDAMANQEDVVIDAPTALGKTYTISTEPWLAHDADVTGNAPVVVLHETKEARRQAAQKSKEAGVDYVELKGRTDLCPLAAGDHDPAGDDDVRDITMGGEATKTWIDRMCNGKGIPYSNVHVHIEEENDQGATPACEQGNRQCGTKTQFDGVPRDDSGNPAADVIHATHQFAHVPGLVRGANVVFDERPDFAADMATPDVRRHVEAFLDVIDAPVRGWRDFLHLAAYDPDTWDRFAAQGQRRVDKLRDAINRDPPREWYFEESDAHLLAPALARAVFAAVSQEPDANGRRMGRTAAHPPRLDANADDADAWNLVWVTVVLDDDDQIATVRTAPDLRLARSVIGLDAHPSRIVWERNTLPDIDVDGLLERQERKLWRQFERGLCTVTVGDATRPLTSGEYFAERQVETVAEHLREHFGTDFGTAITSAACEGDVEAILRDAGVDDPVTMHFGEEKSRNDFADESIGYVEGCIDPGDDYVIDLLAEAGLDAWPATDEDGNRRHGREFDGPDAPEAREILSTVREQHVAQSAGRYARNPEDPTDTAIVFMRTDAHPDGFADFEVPGVIWAATDLQREIVEALRDAGEATVSDIADAADCSKEHVRSTLKRLADEGVVHARDGEGDYGADIWVADGSSLNTGVADLDTANGDVWSLYDTWSLAIEVPAPDESEDDTTDAPSEETDTPVPEADRPPDDPDQLTLTATDPR